MFIGHHTSLTRTIANSPDIRQMFEHRAALQAPDARRVRDLQHAKARFQSTQKPLGRFVVYLPAMVATAHEVLARRTTSEVGNRAKEFLQNLDEDRIVTLAMLADAGDEAGMVVRFFDTQGYDLAAVPAMLNRFIEAITALFIRRGCVKPVDCGQTSCHTFTSFALDMLRGEPLHLVTRSETRSIGGPTWQWHSTVDRCLARMMAWVRLAIKTVQAEFPHFEVLSAFAAFDLDQSGTSVFARDALHRLSAVFGVSHDALIAQFNDFRRAAVTYRKHHDLSNYDAWAKSLNALDASSSLTRDRHPCQELRAVLCRYGAFLGASASSVERTFSVLVNAAGKQRSSMSTTNMTVDLRLKTAPPCNAGDHVLLVKASAIWAQKFGLHKKSGPTRKRRWQGGGPNLVGGRSSLEAQITAKRRKAASQLVVNVREQGSASAALGRLARDHLPWTEGHTKALPSLCI